MLRYPFAVLEGGQRTNAVCGSSNRRLQILQRFLGSSEKAFEWRERDRCSEDWPHSRLRRRSRKQSRSPVLSYFRDIFGQENPSLELEQLRRRSARDLVTLFFRIRRPAPRTAVFIPTEYRGLASREETQPSSACAPPKSRPSVPEMLDR
jgi:hypothetical protein